MPVVGPAIAQPHLLWLGDIIPVPGPRPLGNVLSIGDLVIYAGMLVLLHNTAEHPQAPGWTPHPTAEGDPHRNH